MRETVPADPAGFVARHSAPDERRHEATPHPTIESCNAGAPAADSPAGRAPSKGAEAGCPAGGRATNAPASSGTDVLPAEVARRVAEVRAAGAFYRHCAAVARGGGNLACDERRARAYDERAHALAWAADFVERHYLATRERANPGLGALAGLSAVLGRAAG